MVTSHVYFHIFVSATALRFTEFGEGKIHFAGIQGTYVMQTVPTIWEKTEPTLINQRAQREGFQASLVFRDQKSISKP